MKITSVIHLSCCAIAALALIGTGGASATAVKATKSKAAKFPYSKVEPLIKAKCISCHNPERHPKSVNLATYKDVMASGDSEKIVVAGHPEKSKLIAYVDGTKKPVMPIGQKPLSKSEVALLKKWIKSGASE